ncbi:MAG: ATP-dependent DNA ligase [Polyangia bacterium]
MRLSELVAASESVAATRARLKKRDLLAELLLKAGPDERRPVVAWLSGELVGGKLGVGWAELSRLDVLAADVETLTVADVEAVLSDIAASAGRGSTIRRRELLIALFMRSTQAEQGFLRRLMVGELRQGGLDGVMMEAVAYAAKLEPDRFRRAVMLAGDLPKVAALALSEGVAALDRVRATVFTPIQAMLASPSEGLGEAIVELGGEGSSTVLLDWKLDGARVQVHREGDEVRVYTRALQEVTTSVPEIVEVARSLPARNFILDGETIALRPDGRPRPFQETQSRFARRLEVEAARATVPLSVFFFDLLLVDDELWLDHPLAQRRARLDALLPVAHRVPSLECNSQGPAQAFLDDAVGRGHEGVMVKSLSAPYLAGSRGRAWQKVKRVHTLDLVVLAAEWGSGRRRGWLSNLHLGARDAEGGFVMLGKTFKGMTDEILKRQTEELLAREVSRDDHVVHVRPELVVEIAFDGVQASSQYAGGLALRFARVVRYRGDKPVEEADTIDAVRAIFVHDRVLAVKTGDA